ncbi:MAG: hypothetical protein ACRYFS_12675 [Janthinobacterium lividum]
MRSYYFVDWRQASEGEGIEADLPENAGYWVVASPRGRQSVLVECDLSEEIYDQLQEKRVSDQLEDLLNSARQYAPAFALMRRDAERKDFENRIAFECQLIESLHKHLGEQRQHPYFLAKALVSQTGYKYAGTYYWIVGYRPERIGHELSWVSHDFYVYQDSIADFEVDVTYLELAFK